VDGKNVTSTELEIAKMVEDQVGLSKCHKADILNEDTSNTPLEGSYWIVDNIDGTENFVHGLTPFSFAMAKIENKVTKAAAVYDPIRDHLYVACNESNAQLNGKDIHVSDTTQLDNAVIGFDTLMSTEEARKRGVEAFGALVCAEVSVRKYNSAALDICKVAAGNLDGYVCPNKGYFSPWDFIAAGYILERAGGKLTNFQDTWKGVELEDRLASNGVLHDELLEVVKVI